MTRLYADENFPLPVVQELRRLGQDVLTTAEAGKSGLAISDEDVLKFATQESRALLTLNRRHFVRLHSASSQHSGIIVCTFDPDSVRQAHRVELAIRDLHPLQGRIIRVNRPGR